MKYIAAGNTMIDNGHYADGRRVTQNLGGPAPFAYSGIRIWDDEVQLISNVGRDFYTIFKEWLDKNNVDTSGIVAKLDTSNHIDMYFDENGDVLNIDSGTDKQNTYLYAEKIGYLKLFPEELSKFTEGRNVKGLYMAQNTDRLIWEKFAEIKKRDGFKYMWEIECAHCVAKNMEDILFALQYTDVFSLNIGEARNLFQTDDEDEIIRKLKELPVEMILFRVGKRGLFTIKEGKHYYHDSIKPERLLDPAGCGNTSTGSAMYAYCETDGDPIAVGIMANIAAALNISYYGIIPHMEAEREKANAMAKELISKYKSK
ncbi:MAG: carbohydrate kinase family protein [Ruminococcaceae bacterium]|nr:carbohydrate kinase family protein [Oscillospiraceae bacterium]